MVLTVDPEHADEAGAHGPGRVVAGAGVEIG